MLKVNQMCNLKLNCVRMDEIKVIKKLINPNLWFLLSQYNIYLFKINKN